MAVASAADAPLAQSRGIDCADAAESALATTSLGAAEIGLEQALILLRALADPIRLQVVEALAGRERCVCELTEALDLAQSKLSFHLKVMKQAGLITARQQGRWVYYRLDPGALGALQQWLKARAAGGLLPAPPCA